MPEVPGRVGERFDFLGLSLGGRSGGASVSRVSTGEDMVGFDDQNMKAY